MRLIAFLSVAFLLAACSENTTESNGTQQSGEDAPGFTLQSLDHGTISLSNYPDDIVVLFFLGYNCPLCIGEGPEVEKLFQDYKDQGVQVLGLDVWDGSAAELANNFKLSTGSTYPLLQMASAVGTDYGVNYDSIVIVNRQQEIVYKKRRVNISEIENILDNQIPQGD